MCFKHFEMLLFYCVIIVGAKIEDDFIYDYFVHKKVPNVVGFTCDRPNDDFSLLKMFNKIGIKTMLNKLFNGSISHVIRANYYKVGIFIDLRYCDSVVMKIALTEAANSRLYDELCSWLLLGHNLENTIRVVDDSTFGLSTDFVIVSVNDSNKTFILYDVYNPWKQGQGKLNITRLATWNPQTGFHFYMSEVKFTRRLNLHGITLRTASYRSKYFPENVSIEHYLENCERNPLDGHLKFKFFHYRCDCKQFVIINKKLFDKAE